MVWLDACELVDHSNQTVLQKVPEKWSFSSVGEGPAAWKKYVCNTFMQSRSSCLYNDYICMTWLLVNNVLSSYTHDSLWSSSEATPMKSRPSGTLFTIMVYIDNWPVSVLSLAIYNGREPFPKYLYSHMQLVVFLPLHHVQCVDMSFTLTIKLLFLTPAYYNCYLQTLRLWHWSIPCVQVRYPYPRLHFLRLYI